MSRASRVTRARVRGPGERARAGRSDRERGSITLMLAALSVALIALAGIVIDGGAKLRAAERTDAPAGKVQDDVLPRVPALADVVSGRRR